MRGLSLFSKQMPNLHKCSLSHPSQKDFSVYMATTDHRAKAVGEDDPGKGINELALRKRKPSTTDQEGREGQKPRGRPAGSRNKLKPPTIITGDNANALRLHIIEIPNGRDVIKSLEKFVSP